jgi:hypothetical protein
LNEEEFAEEVVDAFGAFVDENKWYVSKLNSQLRKEKK